MFGLFGFGNFRIQSRPLGTNRTAGMTETDLLTSGSTVTRTGIDRHPSASDLLVASQFRAGLEHLVIVGFFRELLGSGTLLGIKVLGDPITKTGLYSIGYENNGFMLLSPMALIVVGLIIWVQRSKNKALIEEN